MNDLIDVNEDKSKLQVASDKLDKGTEKIATKIIRSKDLDEVKDLTALFNLQQTKKSVLRTMTYNQLVDSIIEQMQERVSKRADQFSNKELLDYLKIMNEGIEKAQQQINNVSTAEPLIQFNQQNNTVVVNQADQLDAASRQRVSRALSSILAKMKNPPMLEVVEENVSESDEIIESESVYDNVEVQETPLKIKFNEEEN